MRETFIVYISAANSLQHALDDALSSEHEQLSKNMYTFNNTPSFWNFFDFPLFVKIGH